MIHEYKGNCSQRRKEANFGVVHSPLVLEKLLFTTFKLRSSRKWHVVIDFIYDIYSLQIELLINYAKRKTRSLPQNKYALYFPCPCQDEPVRTVGETLSSDLAVSRLSILAMALFAYPETTTYLFYEMKYIEFSYQRRYPRVKSR